MILYLLQLGKMIAQHIEVLILISLLAKENVEVRDVAQW